MPRKVVLEELQEPLVAPACLNQSGDRLPGHVRHRPALYLGNCLQLLGQAGVHPQQDVLGSASILGHYDIKISRYREGRYRWPQADCYR